MGSHEVPAADQDLVFICGALRSGTTLLRLMVNHHPKLANPGEMDFLFEGPSADEGADALERYRRDITANRVFRSNGLKIDQSLSYRDLIRSFITQLRKPGRRLSINVHRNFHLISAIFPEARYVHLLRDPRDVAKSAIGMGWAGNVYHGVDHWIDSERDFERLAANVPAEVIYTLKNEDLIVSPQASLGALCAFMGVTFDGAMLEYPTDTTYSAPDPALIEQWKTNLTAKEVGLVENKVREMLAGRGYAESGMPMVDPGGMEKFLLRQSNRIGRLAFSAKRYGAGLTALDIVARRLPIDALKEFTRAQIEEKTVEYLK